MTTKKKVVKKKVSKKKVVKKKPVKKQVKKKRVVKVQRPALFTEGLVFPWNRAVGLFNILWIFLPIFGWLALAGYIKKITLNIVAKKYELPEFGIFSDNLVEGFWIAVKLFPLYVISYAITMIPKIGLALNLFVAIFYLPLLVINFYVKGTFESTFELSKVTDMVFGNLWDYIVALVKTIGFALVYIVLSVLIIGIPALKFGQKFYLADFYRRHA